MPFYRLMGQIFVAASTWDSLPDVREAMSKAGLTKDQVEAGRKLVAAGEALVTRRDLEGPVDWSASHNLNQALAELDMWIQTVASALRSRVKSDEAMERVIKHGLVAQDHTVTTVAGAIRALGVLRTSKEIEEALGERYIHDLIVRGRTLLAKVITSGTVYLTDRSIGDGLAVYKDIQAHGLKMEAWLQELARAAEKVKDKPEILGLVGYLPDGVGRPDGGTSFAVPLHKRAQREAPDPTEKGSRSGWSIGRQGRNKENLGGGFIEPSFD